MSSKLSLDDILEEIIPTENENFEEYGRGIRTNIDANELKRDKVRQQIKSLFIDLTNSQYKEAYNRGDSDPVYKALVKLRKSIKEL